MPLFTLTSQVPQDRLIALPYRVLLALDDDNAANAIFQRLLDAVNLVQVDCDLLQPKPACVQILLDPHKLAFPC